MPTLNNLKKGKSSTNLPPPPSPEILSPNSNKSILDDFSSLPPPPPPIAIIDMNNSPAKNPTTYNNNKSVTTMTATDMLEKSLRNLQVSEKEEFRTNAGKIISLMLESRLNDKETVNDMTDNHILNKRPMETQDNYCKQKQNGGKIQMIVPQTTLTEIKTHQNNHGKFIVSTALTPTVSLSLSTSQPLATNMTKIESSFGQSTQNGLDEFKQPNGDTFNGNHTNNGGVVFRNKESKLTTHARDRRSYIEKDPPVINNNNSRVDVVNTNNNINNNKIAVGTTDKASELVDGKQPVCSCCNTKITR